MTSVYTTVIYDKYINNNTAKKMDWHTHLTVITVVFAYTWLFYSDGSFINKQLHSTAN